jgi:prepilin-type N-terminal cleavage/methylation domain-containing protein
MKAVVRNRSSSTLAFTLIELLVVISIIALMAGLAVPVLNGFKTDVVDGAARQLLDDVARARQLAITHRTTVYMVFVPTNFWNDLGMPPVSDLISKTNADRLLDKQLVAYNFVSLRSVGDQPGRPMARYLGSWKTLPDGVYIPPEKFLPRNPSFPIYDIYTNNLLGSNPAKLLSMRVYGFNITTNVPFPAETTPLNPGRLGYTKLPYIAFDYRGQLTSGQNEYIPITKGAVLFQRDRATGEGLRAVPAVRESPAGNVTNAFNVVSIDWLTGRAHLEREQLQ